MKRAEVLLSLAGIVMATSYITGNPVAALIGAAIIAQYSMARASFSPRILARREIQERGTEREPIKATITIENLSSVNGTVKIQETSRKVFAKELRTNLKSFEKRYMTQTIVPQAKGRIALKAKAIFNDDFELFKREFEIEGKRELTVFPSQKSIRDAMKEKREVDALTEAQKALGIGTETLEFEELREFLPGDDITKIDWKATSRLQKLVVRVFKRETLADVYILINTDSKFRRELIAGRIDYLVLILAQLITYFRRFGHTIRVISYDENGVVKSFEHSYEPLEVLKELGLKGEKGIPPLRPAKIERSSSFTRKILTIKGSSGSSGIVKAAMKPETGSYVIIIDDIGLHPMELMKAARLLSKKGSKSVVIYPNPILFLNKSSLDKKTLESAYRAYQERKKIKRKVLGWIKVVEVGPKDLLPRVVREL